MDWKRHIFSKSFREYGKHAIPPLAELLTTEEQYIKNMELLINGYIAEYHDENSSIPVPEGLKGVSCLLFYNIRDIYEWHKNYFLKALREHQNSLTEIGQVFTQNEHQFHMYAKYCNNMNRSNYLICKNKNYFDEVRKKLGHEKEINALLAEPFQRLTRYSLILAAIVEHIRKNRLIEHLDSLNAALSMIKSIGKTVNEFTALQFISNFDRRISEQGKLLFQGHLICKYDGKKHKQYVLLFQELLIFTTKKEAKNKYIAPTYTVRLQIPMNKLQMKELEKQKFLISSTDPRASEQEIVCKADTMELYQQWLNAIKEQISIQQKFILSLVNPSSNEDERDIFV